MQIVNMAANMAEECTGSSMASSSATPNWWPDLHVTSLSSWSSNTNPWQPQNPNSNSSGEEDVSISTSFTNASNQSGLSVDSPRHLVESASASELIAETASDNHLWINHVLLSSTGQEAGENSINFLPSKASCTGIFEPACDYLKKMDNSWELTSPPSLNNFEKQFNGFNDGLIESERLNKLSNLVSHWSIAPPDSEINHQFDPRDCHISLSSTMDHRFPQSTDHFVHMKQTMSNIPTLFGGSNMNRNSGSFPCNGHLGVKVKDENGGIHFSGSGSGGYEMGLNNSMVGDSTKYYCGMPDVPCTNTRSFTDLISFNSLLSKPSSVDVHASKPVLRSLHLPDSKKQGNQSPNSHHKILSTSHTRGNTFRGQGINNDGKKKRLEEASETNIKKAKHENSTVSAGKVQVQKVKIADKISALQQIVSPFGKTDTASVLGEAIGYIKFLQEQVQLLSNPYMKANASKDPWGALDRKGREEMKLDLKSRGLCLVPISCTPQVYREITGSDYWTPTYRGCLYR
ncbi:transcription factor bHLH111 [Diospyros lotus]|uniref:transcription factor bHLH111 n=1 Tax=Diospyros lotus TaxID=55363 RepID=UPI00225B2A97|nr:transcription factor bHLH111 [Diospyros lotus]